MKITLKNLKHSAFASHETECFEAIVFIDGIKAGSVENDGRGGSHLFFPYELEKRLDAYGATLPPIVSEDLKDPDDWSKPFSFEQDAETLINDVLHNELATKKLRTLLKTKLVFLDNKGGISTSNGKMDAAKMQTYLAKTDDELKKLFKFPDLKVVLNRLSFEEALSLYRKAVYG